MDKILSMERADKEICGTRMTDNCADYDGGGGGGGNENGGGDTATVVGTYNNQLKSERMKRQRSNKVVIQ